MTAGVENLQLQVAEFVERGELDRADRVLTDLAQIRRGCPDDERIAAAHTEAIAQVVTARRYASDKWDRAPYWDAGLLARHEHPDSEAVAMHWARVLCHMIAHAGKESEDLTFRYEQALDRAASRFPASEGVQYWNAQSHLEMVSLLAKKGNLAAVPIYLRSHEELCERWPQQTPYWALYAMALSTAVAAYAQTQNAFELRRRLEELARVEERYPESADVRKAYARGLQQAAWFCGEAVRAGELHEWAMRLARLLKASDVRSEVGSLALAEMGIYAVHFLQRGLPDLGAEVLREACSLMELTAIEPDEVPIIVDTFRRAAQALRDQEPELAQWAERRSARLLT